MHLNIVRVFALALPLIAAGGCEEDTMGATVTITPTTPTANESASESDSINVTLDANATFYGTGGCTLSTEAVELLVAHNAARAVTRDCGATTYPPAPPISWHCQLEQSSLAHSLDMAQFDFMEHTGTDGLSPFDRMENAGYTYLVAGENIAAGQADVATVMQGWLESEGHCQNIMNPDFTEMGGISVSQEGTTYGIYWTVNLGASL